MDHVIQIRNDSLCKSGDSVRYRYVGTGTNLPAVEPVAGRSLYQVARPLGALNSKDVDFIR